MRSLMNKLLGGRPMTRLGFAFTDVVSGANVYYFRDRFGREWLSTGAWSCFRVPWTIVEASEQEVENA